MNDQQFNDIFANLDAFQKSLIRGLENVTFKFPSYFNGRSGGKLLSPDEIDRGEHWKYAMIQCKSCNTVEALLTKERLHANCGYCGKKFLP